MTLAWTDQFLSMDDVALTAVGGADSDFDTDDWGNVRFNGDGVNNGLTIAKLLENADGNKHVIQFWFKGAASSNDEYYYTQGFHSALARTDISIYKSELGTMTAVFKSNHGPVDRLLASIPNTVDMFDGVERLLTVAVNGDTDTIDMYLNAVQEGGGAAKVGTGWSGPNATIQDTTIGKSDDGLFPMSSDASMTRLKVANASFPTLSEVEGELAAELTAQGGDTRERGATMPRITAPVYPEDGVYTPVFKL